MDKKQAFQFIDENSGLFTDISDRVWDYAETAFEEEKSAAALCAGLEELGFAVERGVAEIKTAFVGSFGSGFPVIAILGEFDALSGMSQKAYCDVKEAEEKNDNNNGHGCGHNMLGAASLAAAAAVKEYLQRTGKEGTVRYYGCPGEEGGSGKAFMARAGVFDDVDVAFTWHPNYANAVMDVSTLANYQVLYKFKGTASHAAMSPHLGRSALDAMELMNVGVNFLREHVISSARIHYAITNTGGFSPNVVQPEAEVLYLIRAPKSNQVEEIYQRVNKIAQGAALMTETEVEVDFIKSCADVVPNKTLFEVMYHNLKEADLPEFTEEEQGFAAKMSATLTPETYDKSALIMLTPEDARSFMVQMKGKSLCDVVVPFRKEVESKVLPGSSDVGDVSWNVPTAQVATACYSLGTPGHSWQLVAQGRSTIAHKGLIYAGKVMAGSAIDVLNDHSLVKAAKEELLMRLDGNTYHCAIPDDVKPKAMKDI